MKTRKTILIAGLLAAIALPGIASADGRYGYSIKEQAREHRDARDSRRDYREQRGRFGHRKQQRPPYAFGHDNHHRHHAHGHRKHGRHHVYARNYWRHHHGRHIHSHDYRDHRHHHSGLSISGLYLTPNIALDLHLGR